MNQKAKRILALTLSAVLAFPAISTPVIPAQAAAENTIFSDPETIQVSDLGAERTTLFNAGWKFFLGNSSNAQEVDFNDSDWRSVDLPHDYSVEQDFTLKGEAESGFLPGGTGWYRKSFTLPEECASKAITIDFGGVYMNATVYVNGKKVGIHPYGYTGFAFDISDEVICDGSTQNVIAVKVDNKLPSSRYYSGSGIYRDVHLNVMEQVHLSRRGITVTTPDLEAQQSGNVDVKIAASIDNDMDYEAAVTVKNTVYNAEGQAVSSTVSSDVSVGTDSSAEVEQTAQVSQPDLWSVESPTLYSVKTEILNGSEVIDSYETEFGFRYFEMDTKTGFSLNGENMKLKGVCMHHDQGSLGAKAYADAIERQVKMLQEMGCNSIRVTHNPAADILVELCDRYGILLIDEAFDTWLYPKNGNSNDYSGHFNELIGEDNQIIGGDSDMTWAEYDMKEMVSRGKNAPSIIMWSLGNELMEGTNSGDFSSYPTIARNLIAWGKEIDSTRLFTTGENKLKASWDEAFQLGDVLMEEGGAVGGNYCNDGHYSSLHSNHPNFALYGSETASAISSRGVYSTKGQNDSTRELTAYDKTSVGWGATASSAWYDVIKNDFVAGTYVWTGFDYIGEPTPWNGTGTGGGTNGQPYPKSSYFGIIDTAGFPKDDYYLYQSVWNDKVHTLHVLPCWDEENIMLSGGKAEVAVYTDAAKVELYLNGKKVDQADSTVVTTPAGYQYRQWQGKTGAGALYPTFNVTYEAGTLTAKAFDENGTEITNTNGRSTVETSGTPTSLELNASYSYGDYTSIDADGYSLSYISVDVLDEKGVIDPDAANNITFTVEGNGELVGTDNGDQRDTTRYAPASTTKTDRRAYSGKALAIVKSTTKDGSFTLTASADGLQSDSITVTANKVEGSESTGVTSYQMPKHCYVKQGADSLTLPEKVSVHYADDSSKELPVVWENIDSSLLNKTGNFKVTGIMQDQDDEIKVSITVHVYGHLVSAENYSGITAPNTMPTLPNVMKTYLENGYTYEEFPVSWDLSGISEESFGTVNTVVSIPGTVTTVFSETFPVTASVRVAEPMAGKKANIAPEYLDLTESCASPSDNLVSIVNGVKFSSEAGGQSQRWTNWNDMSDPASPSITFTWATVHLIDELRLFFYTDSSASCQALDKTLAGVSFEYSVNGVDWLPIGYDKNLGIIPDVDSSVANEKVQNGRIFKLDNNINPIGIRITLAHDTGKFVGLSEVEVMSNTYSYEANTSADLSGISINGTAIEDFDPETIKYTISGNYAELPAITAASDTNAAYTILPVYGNTARILTVSEDRTESKIYTVTFEDMDTSVKITNMTGKADSEQTAQNPQPASNAVDGDSSTHWHSNWSSNDVTIDPDNPQNNKNNGFTIDLGAEYFVNKLEYLPRQGEVTADNGAENGRISTYRLLYSLTGNADDFTEVTLNGNTLWKNSADLKTADFDAVTARYLRVEALTTYGAGTSQNNKFISAAEFYVYRQVSTECICEISNLVFGNRQLQIPYDQDTLEYKLQASAKLSTGCMADGHENPSLQYTYEIEENDDQAAELAGDILTFKAEGTVKVKTTVKAVDAYGKVIKEDSASASFTAAKEPAPTLYTLTFMGDGDTSGTAPASITGKAGDKVTLPKNTLTKDNHDFTGWSDGKTVYEENAEYTIGSSDVTFTAVWERTEVPSVKIENISGKADSEQTTQPGSYATDGNTSTHWHSNWSNNTVTIDPSNPQNNSDNGYTIDLGAKYQVTKLEYLPRQGSGDGDQNGRITKYRILYGDSEDNLTEAVLIGENTWANNVQLKTARFETVSARFIRIEALDSVTNQAGKSFISAAEFYVYRAENSTPTPVCTCTLDNMTFNGGNIQIPLNASDAQITLQASATLGGSCKIEGHASAAIRYTFEVEEDKDNIVSSQNENILTVNKSGTVKVKATASVNDKKASKSASFTVTKETEEITYTLSFTGGDSSGTAPQNITGKSGATVTLPANTFTKEGYVFKGWDDGTKVYAEKASYTIGGKNITFTAVWEKQVVPDITYTLSFIGDSSTAGTAPQAITGKSGATVTLPANTFTKEGYLFKGWNDGAATYAEKASYKIGDRDVTFTAVWEKQIVPSTSYTLSFTGGSGAAGTAPQPITAKSGIAVTLPGNTFTRAGYLFKGWSDGTKVYAEKASYTVGNKDVTFTAVWEKQADPVKVNRIKLTAASKDMAAGKKLTVKASVSPVNAANKTITWKSSNSKYASVTSKGVVTLKKAGAGKTVTITAAAADGSKTIGKIKIRIRKNAVKKISLKASAKTVKAGKKVTVKASVKPAENVNKKLNWKTSNTKYATVSAKGVVKTKKAGKGKTVTITAQATDGSKKTARIKIKIK